MHGPGLFWIVPFIDSVSSWIDQRVITTSFAAEQTLTSDTVPVNVDAVLFWMVYDAEKAALEVQQYQDAVSWAAQTALRDIIGRTSLSDLLRGREQIEDQLQELIDSRCNPWGVTVQSVEMRDVIIPDALQDAMSREAQATREKSGPHHPGRSRSGDRQAVPGRLGLLPREPDRPPPESHEHALRRPEGKGRDDDRAVDRRRIDGDGRFDGNGSHGPTPVNRNAASV
ncbi:MAG: SPFH domain-containing protein [Vicinamibacterales bacterium]